MRDKLEIGPCPLLENAIQVSKDSDYYKKMYKQCEIFRNQLIRTYPDIPEGVTFGIVANSHEFGSYCEVVVKFDNEDEKQIDFAFSIEKYTPDRWDAQSQKELVENGIPI